MSISLSQVAAILVLGFTCVDAIGRIGPTNFVGPDLERRNYVTDEVTFTVQIGRGKHAYRGNFTIGLFGDINPITCYNFLLLSRGYGHREQLWRYNLTQVHRIVPDMLVQMGDVLFQDGRSGRAVYAPYFIDENFVHGHRAAGYVGMANSGQDTNGSQFYVTMARLRWLDGRNVVFGKVVEGMTTLKRLTQEPYELSEEDLNSHVPVKDPEGRFTKEGVQGAVEVETEKETESEL